MTDAPYVIVAGPDDHGLGEELETLGATVTRIDGVVSGKTLREAGIADASILVITDVEEATGIPVAKELNPDVMAVTYADRSLPEFVAAIADLSIDPDLISADVVAEELLGNGPE